MAFIHGVTCKDPRWVNAVAYREGDHHAHCLRCDRNLSQAQSPRIPTICFGAHSGLTVVARVSAMGGMRTFVWTIGAGCCGVQRLYGAIVAGMVGGYLWQTREP